MPNDGPRHFELENTFGKFRLRAKQPAQLAVLAPAAGSRRPTQHRSTERERVSVSRLRFPFLLVILRRSGLANARNAAIFRGRRAVVRSCGRAVVRSCGRAVVRSCGRVRASVSENSCESTRVVYNHNQIDRRKAPNSITTRDLDEDSETRRRRRRAQARVCGAAASADTAPPFADAVWASAGNDLRFLPEQPEQPRENRDNSAENGRI